MTFVRRHFIYIVIAVFGMAVAYGLYAVFGNMFQIGLNPFEFLIKVFAKLVYLGASVMATHFVVKYFFTTIYWYCKTDGNEHSSEFMRDWTAYGTGEVNLSHKMYIAVGTHVGVFIGICVLMALAF